MLVMSFLIKLAIILIYVSKPCVCLSSPYEEPSNKGEEASSQPTSSFSCDIFRFVLLGKTSFPSVFQSWSFCYLSNANQTPQYQEKFLHYHFSYTLKGCWLREMKNTLKKSCLLPDPVEKTIGD